MATEQTKWYESGLLSILALLAFALLAYMVFLALRFMSSDIILDFNTYLEQSNREDSRFDSLRASHPKSYTVRDIPRTPDVFDFDLFYHNIVRGVEGADLKLTVFTDPACTRCMRQMREIMSLLPEDSMIIQKYYPQDPADLTSGLYYRLAKEQENYLEILHDIDSQTTPLDLTGWIDLLERHGLSLTEQRQWLAAHSLRYVRELQQDMQQLDNIGNTNIPVFMLNGYHIDGVVLTLANLPRYADRILAGEPVMQMADFRTLR